MNTIQSLLAALATFFSVLFAFRHKADTTARDRRRRLEDELTIRKSEYTIAMAGAARLQEIHDQHQSSDDWSREQLEILHEDLQRQLGIAKTFRKRVHALQKQLASLATAIGAGNLIADSELAISTEELDELDRGLDRQQRRVEAVNEAESALRQSMLAEEYPAPTPTLFPLTPAATPQPQRAGQPVRSTVG